MVSHLVGMELRKEVEVSRKGDSPCLAMESISLGDDPEPVSRRADIGQSPRESGLISPCVVK
jgi:hypothetical protein